MHATGPSHEMRNVHVCSASTTSDNVHIYTIRMKAATGMSKLPFIPKLAFHVGSMFINDLRVFSELFCVAKVSREKFNLTTDLVLT